MTIYKAMHNPSPYTGEAYVISLHRTPEGAEKAIISHKEDFLATERITYSGLSDEYLTAGYWWGVVPEELLD